MSTNSHRSSSLVLVRALAFTLAACIGICGYMQRVSVAVAQPVRKDTLTQQEVPAQADRVPAHPDFSVTTRLSGGLPGWANAANDAGTGLGVVPPETLIHMNFVLTRAPQLEAAFNQLLEYQQNPASPRFHHWLTPQQVGLYGPTPHDLDALSSWLSSQGITVEGIAPESHLPRSFRPGIRRIPRACNQLPLLHTPR